LAMSAGWLSDACKVFRSIGFIPSHLTADAISIDDCDERRLLRHYREAVRKKGTHSLRLLVRCVNDVPQCAEPRLLLSAVQLAAGDAASAFVNAHAALHYLRGWGAAWDTRVPHLAWEMMGSQLLESARGPANGPPAIATQIMQLLARSSAPR
jgi:hypothetical protein